MLILLAHVLITDLSMPGDKYGDGITLIKYIKRHFPSLSIIVLTTLNVGPTLDPRFQTYRYLRTPEEPVKRDSPRRAFLKNILQSGERIVRVSQEGKPSETRFKVEERYAFATLVRCSPVTGRTHQIRVHTQYAGHPIAFDDRYGDREFDKQLAGTGLSRLFLHAAALKFTHPNTGEVMRVEAPLDEQLKRCLKVLRDAT
jgi:hypothetical protein